MPLPVFIGDEVSAAGFRLAGLRVRTPQPDAVLQTLEESTREAPLVLVSAGIARHLPAGTLDRLLAALEPQVVIVPDVYHDTPLPDLATRVRRQLGVLE
ncbi:MAG: V-type ATP synthase subunit F [Gammaproteobacteria bacterium]|jgi:vacuolar-type H+-ATPase subunit F/Vma7